MGKELAIDAVTVLQGGQCRVENFSTALPAGQVYALLGPNGAGKSSLLRALAGHPDYAIASGSLTCDGESLRELSAEQRARKGLFLAFQSPVELPGVPISQLLRAARQVRLEEGQILDVLAFHGELLAAMDRLAMDHSWAGRGVNEGCSGGEKKRCELLQILLLKPRYALLDEMDSGLDRDALRLMAGVLDGLRREGMGILLVTHRKSLLDLLPPDRVLLLRDGKLLRSGGRELLHGWEMGKGGEAAEP
ncbi:MAG: Fe-S cluster assembly ATPase SufC [Puniceicoccales bacterium]|jgi:Fe-S cluster assembly ATP-binding protein|nr:Fe-S cluster assembly ATPase SufC [Puniceicoccales bacterium]